MLAILLKKRLQLRFSSEFYKILQNTFLTDYLWDICFWIKIFVIKKVIKQLAWTYCCWKLREKLWIVSRFLTLPVLNIVIAHIRIFKWNCNVTTKTSFSFPFLLSTFSKTYVTLAFVWNLMLISKSIGIRVWRFNGQA